MTGLLPPQHGVRGNVGFALDTRRKTLPRCFRILRGPPRRSSAAFRCRGNSGWRARSTTLTTPCPVPLASTSTSPSAPARPSWPRPARGSPRIPTARSSCGYLPSIHMRPMRRWPGAARAIPMGREARGSRRGHHGLPRLVEGRARQCHLSTFPGGGPAQELAARRGPQRERRFSAARLQRATR